MPPEFKGKINKENQFLCRKGDTIRGYKLNNDGTVNRMVNPIRKYYTNSTTSLPMEILNTGNVEVLQNYMAQSQLDPNSKEYKHLQERISVMQYFNELEDYNNRNPLTPVGPMQKNRNGQNILPGIFLKDRQSSNNGCWSCAMSLLLKSRGVNIDQTLIRRYRPEFKEGLGPKGGEQTDVMNADAFSEIFQYSELIGKLCPNTLVRKYAISPGLETTQDGAKNYIIDCLTKKNTPVAMCVPGHWVTIVGISDDRKDVYISNSMNAGGVIETHSLDDITSLRKVEFVWTESITKDPVTNQPKLYTSDATVDKNTGAVTVNRDAFFVSSDSRTDGNFLADGSTEIYIPKMIRDYSKDYDVQKAEYNQFKETNKSILDLDDEAESAKFKANRSYTYLSDFSYQNASNQLELDIKQAQTESRLKALKEQKKYTDEQIKKMTDADLEKEFAFQKKAPVQPKVQPVKPNATAKTSGGTSGSGSSTTSDGFSEAEIQKAINASLGIQDEDEELKKAIEESLKMQNNLNNGSSQKEKSDLEKAIEESLKEQKKPDNLKSRKEDEDLKKAMEESLKDQGKASNKDSGFSNGKLSEEEALKKAMEESLKDQKDVNKLNNQKEDEDLKKAMEESLKDQGKTSNKDSGFSNGKLSEEEALKKAMEESLKDQKDVNKLNNQKEDEDLKKAMEESLKDQKDVNNLDSLWENDPELKKYAPTPVDTAPKKNTSEETLKDKKNQEKDKNDTLDAPMPIKPTSETSSQRKETPEEKKFRESMEELQRGIDRIHEEAAKNREREEKAAQWKKESKKTYEAQNKTYRAFDKKMAKVENSTKLAPLEKKLQLNVLNAQLTLFTTLKNSDGVINQDCVRATAALLTHVTLGKVCRIKESGEEIINALQDPQNVEKCVGDMLCKAPGEEKSYAERVAESLLAGKAPEHILTLNEKDIYNTMLTDSVLRHTVKPEKSKGNLNKQEAKKPEEKKLENPEVKKPLARRNSI